MTLAGYKLVGRRFSWSWFLLNMIGFTTWYMFPCAPPWFAIEHGLGEPVDRTVKSSPGRLSAVDDYLGMEFFRNFYGRNSNVFGALPSLHCAYPLMCWVHSRSVFPRAHWLFLANAIVTSFAAIYLLHHYVLDALLGIFYVWFSNTVVGSLCTKIEERDELNAKSDSKTTPM